MLVKKNKAFLRARLKAQLNIGTIQGEPAEWEYDEISIEPYGFEWDNDILGYVESLEIDNELYEISGLYHGSIKNAPENAIYIVDKKTRYPIEMYWIGDIKLQDIVFALKNVDHDTYLKALKKLNMTKLEALRNSRGFTQASLANEACVNLKVIKNYEQRVRNINKAEAHIIQKLINTLDCSINDILEED